MVAASSRKAHSARSACPVDSCGVGPPCAASTSSRTAATSAGGASAAGDIAVPSVAPPPRAPAPERGTGDAEVQQRHKVGSQRDFTRRARRVH